MALLWQLRRCVVWVCRVAVVLGVVSAGVLWLGAPHTLEETPSSRQTRPYHVRRIPYRSQTRAAGRGVGAPPGTHTGTPLDVRRRPPGAFLLGAGKCGTGALRRFLVHHPQLVSHAREEMWFYDSGFHQGTAWHLQQMPPSSPRQVTLETSPGYFHSEEAMHRIINANSRALFVVILRDPIHRAISQFVHMFAEGPFIKNGYNARPTAENFKMMALLNDGRVRDNWEPITYGLYIYPLRRWLKYIPREQIHIVDGTDFAKNPLPHLKALEKFLGVDSFFDESQFIYNKTKNFYCIKETGGQTSCLPGSKGRRHPYVGEEVLGQLRRFYRPYNELLYEALGQRFEWT